MAAQRQYHGHVDRLDSWLNRQTGWRRAVFIWLQMCPLAIMIANVIIEFTHALPPWPGLESLAVVACSLVGTVLLAGLFVLLHRSPAGRHLGPVLSWRRGAALYLLMFASVFIYSYAFWYVFVIFLLGSVVLMIDDERRSRRPFGTSPVLRNREP